MRRGSLKNVVKSLEAPQCVTVQLLCDSLLSYCRTSRDIYDGRAASSNHPRYSIHRWCSIIDDVLGLPK